jgi:hypothetical protein
MEGGPMRIILLLTLSLSIQSYRALAQDESEYLQDENDSFSLIEEGSLQSELPDNHFDYSDLDNPELQEDTLPYGEDPFWSSEYQDLEFDEVPPDE